MPGGVVKVLAKHGPEAGPVDLVATDRLRDRSIDFRMIP